MAITLHPDDERLLIRIDGALNIMEIGAAHDQIVLGLATAGGPIEVDLAGVTELDTAGLQLLLALARAPGAVTLAGPSAEVARRLDQFGLRRQLNLREDDHGA